jgi:pimeloyl-ACP methyl ester carboxylesterase
MRRIEGADGVTLAVETTGEGRPVLLLHGFPDSGALWRHQVGPLASAGFQVIVPDLRGFGASDRPGSVDAYRMTAVIADVLAVLDAHGARRADVVGHDWGAGVAWVLAALQPERVRSLAALSVGHPNAAYPRSPESREKAWYQLLFLFDEAEELLLRDDAALLRQWLGDAADLDRYVEDLRRPGALTAGLNWYRANLHPRRELESRALPPVAAATLGVWSSGDRYLTEPAMTRSADHVTGPWRYERIDGAGHWMQLDVPERITELLLEHLAS